MAKKEIMVAKIVKFTAIVTLQKANGEREVGVHIALEIHKHGMNIRFAAEWEGPDEV